LIDRLVGRSDDYFADVMKSSDVVKSTDIIKTRGMTKLGRSYGPLAQGRYHTHNFSNAMS